MVERAKASVGVEYEKKADNAANTDSSPWEGVKITIHTFLLTSILITFEETFFFGGVHKLSRYFKTF